MKKYVLCKTFIAVCIFSVAVYKLFPSKLFYDRFMLCSIGFIIRQKQLIVGDCIRILGYSADRSAQIIIKALN